MDDEQAQRLGRFIRTRREHLGLSSRQLQARCGVRDTTIIRIEHGDIASPKADKLAKIADGLGLAVADVFALADYVAPAELPTLRPYLRARYRDLPDDAVDAIEAYTRRLAKRHGVDLDGPAPGDDETPATSPPKGQG